jgi:deazaflavin-dependent oxidoreductase (nitroreductase family)
MIDPQMEERLRQGFKKINPLMIWLWRLGFRRWINLWPAVGGQIMVITHTGRKSRQRRQTPVNYAEVKGEIYCTAGFGQSSDWYRNLLAEPQIEIWLPDSRWAATAEDISDDPQRLALLRKVIIASGIVAPMLGLDPRRVSEADFDKMTEKYRLIHIHRTKPLGGPGGPGDLAWIWAPVILLLGLLLYRRLRLRSV